MCLYYILQLIPLHIIVSVHWSFRALTGRTGWVEMQIKCIANRSFIDTFYVLSVELHSLFQQNNIGWHSSTHSIHIPLLIFHILSRGFDTHCNSGGFIKPTFAVIIPSKLLFFFCVLSFSLQHTSSFYIALNCTRNGIIPSIYNREIFHCAVIELLRWLCIRI